MDKWLTQDQRDASLLPFVVGDDDGNTVSVTVCDSMAGGAQEVDGMPRRLSLIRWRDGVELRAEYALAVNRSADNLEWFGSHTGRPETDLPIRGPEFPSERAAVVSGPPQAEPHALDPLVGFTRRRPRSSP